LYFESGVGGWESGLKPVLGGLGRAGTAQNRRSDDTKWFKTGVGVVQERARVRREWRLVVKGGFEAFIVYIYLCGGVVRRKEGRLNLSGAFTMDDEKIEELYRRVYALYVDVIQEAATHYAGAEDLTKRGQYEAACKMWKAAYLMEAYADTLSQCMLGLVMKSRVVTEAMVEDLIEKRDSLEDWDCRKLN
jgi:hypothetical protein